MVCYIQKYVIILAGIFPLTSPQPKYWGDVSPASPAGLTPVFHGDEALLGGAFLPAWATLIFAVDILSVYTQRYYAPTVGEGH